ncbi:MAG TPA: aldo/keto reductase [Miltoncostaeaceae bacterium]|nr:aldo/keto reductase [Miltoncostaeaceae bacterium]
MPDLRPFGGSSLRLSPLCLGGNVFGWSADEEASFAVLDAYVAAGGNAIDSANIYAWWAHGNRGGESEAILGRWIAGRGRHDDVVVATKVGMAGGPDQPKGLTREKIRRGAEESLARLGVDRIDLYYAHEDDQETDLAETMGAFDELVREGLVGTVAASNYTAARLAEALEVSDREGLVRFEGLQPAYNLLQRDQVEGGAGDVCREHGLGIASYVSLARGFLTGKYRPGGPLPASHRAKGVARDFMNDRGLAVLAAVDEVAQAHDATPAQVALAWVMAKPGITSAIASATTPGQVRELAGAMDLEITAAERDRLDAAGR